MKTSITLAILLAMTAAFAGVDEARADGDERNDGSLLDWNAGTLLAAMDAGEASDEEDLVDEFDMEEEEDVTLASLLGLDKHGIEMHGFIAQGFMISKGNNFLANTRRGGSFELSEMALNIRKDFENIDGLSVAAQIYMSKSGDTGNYMPKLDYAFFDWRATDWLGIRLGRSKRAKGLCNDTQDLPFAQQWILLPQGVYPLANRGMNLFVDGVSIYGDIPMGRVGDVSYEAFYGKQLTIDMDSGLPKDRSDRGLPWRKLKMPLVAGGDVKWQTPIEGLQLGAAATFIKWKLKQRYRPMNLRSDIKPKDCYAQYVLNAKYTWGNLTLSTEAQRTIWTVEGNPSWLMASTPSKQDLRTWYAAATYRFTEQFAAGIYYSDTIGNFTTDHDVPDNYQKDWVISGRYDITEDLSLKAEAHFLKGAAMDGLFPSSNRGGLDDDWMLFVMKLTYSF